MKNKKNEDVVTKEYGIIFESNYNTNNLKKCLKSWKNSLIKTIKHIYNDYTILVVLLAINFIWCSSLLLDHYNINNGLIGIINYISFSYGGISRNIIFVAGGFFGKILYSLFVVYLLNKRIHFRKLKNIKYLDKKYINFFILGLGISIVLGTFIMGDFLLNNSIILLIVAVLFVNMTNSNSILTSILKSVKVSNDKINNIFIGLFFGFILMFILTITKLTTSYLYIIGLLIIIVSLLLAVKNKSYFLFLLLLIPIRVDALTKSHYGYIPESYSLIVDSTKYAKETRNKMTDIWFLNLKDNQNKLSVNNGKFNYSTNHSFTNEYGYDNRFVDTIKYMKIDGYINPISLEGEAYVEVNYVEDWFISATSACLDYNGHYYTYNYVLYDTCDIKRDGEKDFIMTCDFKVNKTTSYYCIKGKENIKEDDVETRTSIFYFSSDLKITPYKNNESVPDIPKNNKVENQVYNKIVIDKTKFIIFALASFVSSVIGVLLYTKKNYSLKNSDGEEIKVYVTIPKLDVFRTNTRYDILCYAMKIDKNGNKEYVDEITESIMLSSDSNMYFDAELLEHKLVGSFVLRGLLANETKTIKVSYVANDQGYNQYIDLKYMNPPSIELSNNCVGLLKGSKSSITSPIVPLGFISKKAKIEIVNAPDTKDFSITIKKKSDNYYYELNTTGNTKKSNKNNYEIILRGFSDDEECFNKLNIYFKDDGINIDPMGNKVLYASLDERGKTKSKRMSISFGIFDKYTSVLKFIKPENVVFQLKDKKHITDKLGFTYEIDNDFDYDDKIVFKFRFNNIYPKDTIKAKLFVKCSYDNKEYNKSIDIEILPVSIDENSYDNIKYFLSDKKDDIMNDLRCYESNMTKEDYITIENYFYDLVINNSKISYKSYLNIVFKDSIRSKYIKLVDDNFVKGRIEILELIHKTIEKDIIKDKSLNDKKNIAIIKEGLILELFLKEIVNNKGIKLAYDKAISNMKNKTVINDYLIEVLKVNKKNTINKIIELLK